MTVADAYEALTSSRPYRKTPLTHNEAVGELFKFAGIQFDPDVVPVLVGLDRGILDPTPVQPEELHTMRHLPPMRPADASAPKPRRRGVRKETLSRRPRLASDDVS